MTVSQEDDPTTRLQDQRIHRLSGPWRRPDRGDRGAGGRRLQARAVRHQLRQGQDDAARPDREDRGGRHAQARRGADGQARARDAQGPRPRSSAPCGRAAPRNTRPRSTPATSSRSPRSCATSSAPRPQPEQSYSERQLYEAALDRLSREISAVQRITETEAIKEIEAALAKGPRRGPSRRRGRGGGRGRGGLRPAWLRDQGFDPTEIPPRPGPVVPGLFACCTRWSGASRRIHAAEVPQHDYG